MIIGYSRAAAAAPSVVPAGVPWQFPLSVAPDLPVKRLMPNLRVRDDAGWITKAAFRASSFIGRSQGAEAGNSYTYTAAPVATNASDIVVVGVFTQHVLNSPITALTVGGVSMTEWATGNLASLGTVRTRMTVFYGVPGVFATANIVLTTTGIGNPNATLLVWRLRGLNSTPVAEASSASATSGSLTLGAIQANTGGVVIGISAADPVTNGAATETWSGSEAVTEDTDAVDASNNTRIAGFGINAASTATNSFTVTFAGSNTHVGGAISFGP